MTIGTSSSIYYDPFSAEIDRNVHAVWWLMREQQPVYWNERYGFWALSRFEDVWTGYHDTATFSSTHGVQPEALDNPDQRQILVEDPSLIPSAVEELLRYEAPGPVAGRWTLRPYRAHGVEIPAGSKVLLLIGSANRDRREFDEPDRFDVRREIKRHISFGYGAHFCLGAALARLETRLALAGTLARFPRWDIDPSELVPVQTSTVRGFSSVPIHLG